MKPIWFGPFTIEYASRLETETFARYIGVQFTEVGPDFLAGRMLLAPQMKQPFGVLHGGASVALAETLGSVASNFTVDRTKYRCVGQSITASHLRPVPVDGSYVTAIARPMQLEEQRQVWNIELRRADGKKFCVSMLTMAVVRSDSI
jgi:1,4-dihydroxy-2-naphthoyl-CoA hydrolase